MTPNRSIALVLFVHLALVAGAQEATSNQPSGCIPGSVRQMDSQTVDKIGHFLSELQSAVAAQDKRRVASLVHYPLRVVSTTRTRFVRSEASFVKNYNSILSPEITELLMSQRPECVNVMSQGFMIGDGTVWFGTFAEGELKIMTLNPLIPRPPAAHQKAAEKLISRIEKPGDR